LKLRRGELWLVDLEPTRGRELGRKDRPAVIVSTDLMNEGRFERVIVVPSTTQRHDIPCHVEWQVHTPRGPRSSFFCCEDVRSVSVERLIHQFGTRPIPPDVFGKIEDWLRVLMGL
jgi:mRNA interferase MazF